MTARSYLQNADTSEVLIPHLEMADTVWRRGVGLIGRRRLASGAGLWLRPCNGIHTFGLRFSIDVLFLDGEGRIVRVVSGLRPGRICGPVWTAKTVVELPNGALKRLDVKVGTRLEAVAV